MMKIGIYSNIDKDKELSVTKEIIATLQKSGAEVFLFGDTAKVLNTDDSFILNTKPDILLVLGGDGTILRVAEYCNINNIPILGLNTGTVGFLTNFEISEINKLYSALSKKNFKTEERLMLDIVSNGLGKLALNEVVVAKKHHDKLILLAVKVNGELVDNFYCDGFIVATPTGSTAYSLSCLGPIVTPNSAVLVLTPICPHSLHARPIVVSSSDTIEICAVSSECDIIVDGKFLGVLNSGGSVKVQKAQQGLSFIKTTGKNFYYRLINKLSQRTNTKR